MVDCTLTKTGLDHNFAKHYCRAKRTNLTKQKRLEKSFSSLFCAYLVAWAVLAGDAWRFVLAGLCCGRLYSRWTKAGCVVWQERLAFLKCFCQAGYFRSVFGLIAGAWERLLFGGGGL